MGALVNERRAIAGLWSEARRHCRERHAYWSAIYSKLPGHGRIGAGYSDEALRIFPRYNVLSAISMELERSTPESFAALSKRGGGRARRSILPLAVSGKPSSNTNIAGAM